MNFRHRRMRTAVAISAAALVAGPITAFTAHAVARPAQSAARSPTGPTAGLLPASKILLSSASHVDLHNDTVRFPLHRGDFQGKTYWYILTEASDFGLAHDLNVNYAPKLANAAISCAACVQNVTLSGAADNKFGEAVVLFAGVPDVSPSRILTPGPGLFPPVTATVGAVGAVGVGLNLPFIRIAGSDVVYNAPIVAAGDGPFDVTTHTNTGNRVLAIRPAATVRGRQFSEASVDILFVRGFDAGQLIIYISTESSDPVASVLERATSILAL